MHRPTGTRQWARHPTQHTFQANEWRRFTMRSDTEAILRSLGEIPTSWNATASGCGLFTSESNVASSSKRPTTPSGNRSQDRSSYQSAAPSRQRWDLGKLHVSDLLSRAAADRSSRGISSASSTRTSKAQLRAREGRPREHGVPPRSACAFFEHYVADFSSRKWPRASDLLASVYSPGIDSTTTDPCDRRAW